MISTSLVKSFLMSSPSLDSICRVSTPQRTSAPTHLDGHARLFFAGLDARGEPLEHCASAAHPAARTNAERALPDFSNLLHTVAIELPDLLASELNLRGERRSAGRTSMALADTRHSLDRSVSTACQRAQQHRTSCLGLFLQPQAHAGPHAEREPRHVELHGLDLHMSNVACRTVSGDGDRATNVDASPPSSTGSPAPAASMAASARSERAHKS